MVSRPTSVQRLESLVEDVFRLRQIMLQNTQDNEDLKHLSFNYFIDTPTFRLFAEPDRYSETVAALPELATDDDNELLSADEDADASDTDDAGLSKSAYRSAMFASALLTGEYIFQLASRNGKKPVLVSSDHAAEIFAYISWLDGRSRGAFRRARETGLDVYSAVRDLLERESRALEVQGVNAAKWLDRVRQPIVSVISRAASSEMLGPYRLKRLVERRQIANANQALNIDLSVVSPPLREVADWRGRIIRAKAGNSVRPTSNALDADAVTLCQLAMLNEGWQETKIVHVLITSDRGLHRAFARWKRDCEIRDPGKKIFYAIRDPRQYVPILNVKDMETAYRASYVFEKVRDSISTFIASFSSTDEALGIDRDADALTVFGSRAISQVMEGRRKFHDMSGDAFEILIRDEISQIRSHWLEAVELSIAAKADIIADLAQGEKEIWHSALLHGALKANFDDQFTDLQASFENLASTSTLLRHEIWALGQGRQQFEASPRNRRQIASDFSGFRTPIFAGLSLIGIIAEIHGRGDLAVETMKTVAKDSSVRKERFLITGCLSLEIGAWAGARSLLERARVNRPNVGRLASETIFFHCVARRLAATTSNYGDEYSRVRGDLEVLLENNEKTAADYRRD